LDGTKKDYAKISEWFIQSAEQGHAKAQYNLGLLYLGGMGVDKDLTRSIEWFTKSATQGEKDAQYLLGILYLNDTNVAREDIAAIFQVISEAAEQNNTQAKFALGLLFLMGLDNIKIDGDAEMAFMWLKKSAEQGNITTQTIIGMCYEKGIGIEKDISEAIKWHIKAQNGMPDKVNDGG
jgi:TPR repeat protein